MHTTHHAPHTSHTHYTHHKCTTCTARTSHTSHTASTTHTCTTYTTHTHIHAHTHTYTHTHSHTCTRTYLHMHIPAHTQTHTLFIATKVVFLKNQQYAMTIPINPFVKMLGNRIKDYFLCVSSSTLIYRWRQFNKYRNVKKVFNNLKLIFTFADFYFTSFLSQCYNFTNIIFLRMVWPR